jgi:flagellar protein FliT
LISVTAASFLPAWEQALALTGLMLEAARSSDWDRLEHLERHRGQLLDALKGADRDPPITVDERTRKRRILEAILEQDETIRLLTQDWMRELRDILASTRNAQRLGKTYTGP